MEEAKKHKGAGHRKRLREKFLNAGLAGFHDYEVIELLLTLGTPRKDCKETAKKAIARFGTLQGVLEATATELCEIEGIGPNNLVGLKLVKAVCDRYLEKRIVSKDPINNSKELFQYLYHFLRDKKRESFIVIFLDAKNKVINSKMLFEGTLNMSSVYPREVIREAILHQAAALIFAHNHPSGDPTPSQEDIQITRKLIFSCHVMGIVVHEHIIIGDNKYFSFADKGYVNRILREYEHKNDI